VIRGVAFCPHPPVLVPAVAQGAAPELDDLRAACRAAIERTCAGADRVVVLGSGVRTVRHGATARGTLAGFGVPVEVPLGEDGPGPLELPLSLTIGAWLLREYLGAGKGATGWSVAAETPELDTDAALLVMGDGSARRSTAAPGYFDPRAEDHDAAIIAALRAGDPAALAAVEPADLLVAGTAAWRAAAAVTSDSGPQPWQSTLHYADAPYGVGYFVASWVR
jgi:hypothetical protein